MSGTHVSNCARSPWYGPVATSTISVIRAANSAALPTDIIPSVLDRLAVSRTPGPAVSIRNQTLRHVAL